MRVTNSMIMKSSSTNINATKVNVDAKNNQMTTQKKINRPSEDPVIAVRSLRLSTTLNKLNQYADKNIPDAESWIDVTETAILNMKSIITDIRTQCVTGSTGTLTADDRNTILNQLQALQKQMYSEGNADYAGRTVFTGFRTNSTLTFQKDEADREYNITSTFSAANDMKEMRYYDGEVKVPTTEAEVLAGVPDEMDVVETIYNRFQLPYDNIGDLTGFSFATTGGKTWTTVVSSDIHVVDPATGRNADYKSADISSVTGSPASTILTFDTEEDWSVYSAAQGFEGKGVNDDGIVVIKSTGDVILGNRAAETVRKNNMNIGFDYDKKGFKNGELRPEFYFDCSDITNPLDPIKYQKFDDNGDPIRYDIEYNVAANQNLAVNVEAYDVFDSGLMQDVNDMITAVSNAINAHSKIDKIKSMMKENQYATDECQAKLKEWLSAAQKEADYADDNIQKLYSTNIGKADKYLGNIALSLSTVGCRSDQLAVTKQRVENQQQNVEELQSKNDDIDLSQIIIQYTSAYTAYEASLSAASKLGDVSLLKYI